MTKLLAFLLGVFLFVQCKQEVVTVDKISGVYQVNKDSLSSVVIEGSENALAKTLIDMALNATEINVKVENDSIIGMISLMGMDQKINSELYSRNDSLFFKNNNSETYIIPTDNGLSFEIFEYAVFLDKIKGAKSEAISKKIDEAKTFDLNLN